MGNVNLMDTPNPKQINVLGREVKTNIKYKVDDVDSNLLKIKNVNVDVVDSNVLMSKKCKVDVADVSNLLIPVADNSGKMSKSTKMSNITRLSNIVSLPSQCSDDVIAISDVPIMKVCSQDLSDNSNSAISNLDKDLIDFEDQVSLVDQENKPPGSAFISVKLSIEQSKYSTQTNICIDTGADITLCDSTFLTNHFGSDVLTYIYPSDKIPKLRSASGHSLKILGKINVCLYLGEYKLKVPVIVHESKANVFLLGSDSFYDRLIYDRGKFLAFADAEYPPVPIQYELAKRAVKSLIQYQIAPRSSALIQVKVTDNLQFTGKEILFTPINEKMSNNMGHDYPVINPESQIANPEIIINSVSIINSQGNAFLLVENVTEDILTILPDTEIANGDILSTDNQIRGVTCHIDNDKTTASSGNGQWPISALKGELADKLPSNVIVQWDKICQDYLCSTDEKNEFDESSQSGNVQYVHCKEERKNLLDGTGEGFPTPPSAQSIHSNENSNKDTDAWLENVEHSHLTTNEWDKLRTLLIKHRDAFSKSPFEIGCCNYFKVDLPLKPGTGYLYNKPRPLPFKYREVAAKTISELLAKGVIRPSKSPHATNIVCVKKKTMNGVISHRVCCDLRQVNENSIPNRFPNYWIDDAMAKLQGAIFRTALDFKDAFHMMVLTPESIPVTAFYFNNVLFEYVRVPFGHVCAMNAFCCLMALLCVEYEPASYYADDLMITTKTNHELSRA